MAFQHLLVFQGVLHQWHQRIGGPLFGIQAQALVQADHLLGQGGKEAPGQAALFGEQGLQMQAELITLFLQFLQLAQITLDLELRRVDAAQRVVFVVSAIDGGNHLVGHVGFVLQVMQILLDGAEEMQDGLVDTQGGPAAGEIAAYLAQVFLQAFGARGVAQQLTLTLQQALVGLQTEQALVVQAVVFLGLGGQLEQQLAVVLLMVAEQGQLLTDFLQAQVEHMLAVVHQRQDLTHHVIFDQAFLLRDDAFA